MSIAVLELAAADPIEEAKKDIITKQGQIHALAANLPHVIKVSEPGEMEISTTDRGTVEYLKKAETVLFHEETSTSGYLKEGDKKENVEGKTLLIFDGETLFMEQTENGEQSVSKSKRSQEDLPLYFLDAGKTLGKGHPSLTLLPEETVNNRMVYVLQTVESPGEFVVMGKMKLCFDKETGVLVKAEAFDSRGSLLSSREYTEIKINHEMDENRFRYTPKEGVEIEDLDSPEN
jgi:outer membrane lipoprotein-sorting protein